MTYTSTDLDKLKAALLSGTSAVSINGRTVTFRTQAELRSLIAEVEASLSAQSDTPSKANPRKIKATFYK